jgi:hypothetical protein
MVVEVTQEETSYVIPVNVPYVIEMCAVVKRRADACEYNYATHIEHAMFVDVLKSIAKGVHDPKKLAEEALRTLEIPFPRISNG